MKRHFGRFSSTWSFFPFFILDTNSRVGIFSGSSLAQTNRSLNISRWDSGRTSSRALSNSPLRRKGKFLAFKAVLNHPRTLVHSDRVVHDAGDLWKARKPGVRTDLGLRRRDHLGSFCDRSGKTTRSCESFQILQYDFDDPSDRLGGVLRQILHNQALDRPVR